MAFTRDHSVKTGTALHPLSSSADLDPLLERIGDARYVLLGEASHGTHEFYTWRTAITKRLITEKNFNCIAVEGDWPDCYMINRFVKGYNQKNTDAVKVLREFKRWPTWMWANWEIVALIQWLKEYNHRSRNKAGFYGLDVYSLWESMEVIHEYLHKHDPQASILSANVLKCFEPYGEEGQNYVRSMRRMSKSCANEVSQLLMEMKQRSVTYDHDPEAPLNTRMNAEVIANAEAYYRSMVSIDDTSWNVRDTHMVTALQNIAEYHGKNSKIILWEHNTHVGDARYTSMKDDGLWNVGQLVRERFAREGVYIAGFATYEGSVIAGRHWGAPMEKMFVPPAREGSIEDFLHDEIGDDQLILFDSGSSHPYFSTWQPHRAIGVVYHPQFEGGNYVSTLMQSRYDALLYLDNTTALHPLHIRPDGHLTPGTYPFNF